MSRIGAAAFTICLFGCAEAFNAHPRVVARVEGRELAVRQLAEWMVLGQPLPLTEEVGRELARHWIDVTVFAQRLATGDSLWDSSFVRQAMWLNLQQLSIARFRNTVVRRDFAVTPAAVDSAYRAGEDRVVAHVLKAMPTGATATQRRATRAEAEAIYQRLRSGGSWEEANRASDDSIAISANGNLGVLRRGVALPRFENAAYELGPGEISPVVETQFGYHIIFRPALADVREQFSAFVQQELRVRTDSTYDAQLTRDLNIQVARDGLPELRRIAGAPFAAYSANDAIVTYTDGTVSTARFADYLRLLAPATLRQMTTGDAQELREFAVGIGLQEILAQKVDSAGLQLSDSAMTAVVASYRRELANLRQQLGLMPDSVFADGSAPSENAGRLVDAYFDGAVSRRRSLTPIPPFLIAQLLDGVRWEINPRALTASIELAQRLQAASGESPSGDSP